MTSENNTPDVTVKNILVVDDDPAVLFLAEEALVDEEMRVFTVPSGTQALEKIAEIKPDLVLLDIMMPEIDGFETCTAIRAMPAFENTPIIMLTGRDDVAAVDSAYAAGAWDFSSKPINWPILRHRVRYSLRASDAFSSQRKAAGLSKTLDKSSNEIIAFDSRDHRVTSVNASADRNLGYHAATLQQLRFSEIVADFSEQDLAEELEKLETQQQITLNLHLRRCDGSVYPVEGIVLSNTEDQSQTFICIFQDITERKKTEKRLHQLAYYDDLTGLPNRRLFESHVHKALSKARRADEACAVCIIDLDGFKSVNDAFGHAQGDVLLKQVTTRLASQVRESDSVARLTADLSSDNAHLELARLGGDEFLILLTDFDGSVVPARVADRLLSSIFQPYNLEGQELNITASMGIALYPDDGDCLDVLMQRAHHAMYAAKKLGKNNYAYYSRESGMNSLDRLTLENEMRKALEREEFVLHYQPQIDGTTGGIEGVESLVRWQHPKRGLLAPGEFIDVAEESGLIVPLGDWVLETAMRQLAVWAEMYGENFKCAVNVSGLQMRQDDFLTKTTNMLSRIDRRKGRLVLELTESSIMTTSASRVEWMHEIRSMGAEIAIDDFGTGYSSLSYLKKLPIDYLKIDRSFIVDLVDNMDDRVITNTVFLMAQALGLKVVVEGLETTEQMQVVNEMGKSLIQGFLFSKPLPVDELEAWIENHELEMAQDAVVGS
ncbi:MAG: putative bifunctional diguanylate cyclase/phosphodiesterase [Halioglobus sp.]